MIAALALVAVLGLAAGLFLGAGLVLWHLGISVAEPTAPDPLASVDDRD